MNGTRRIFFEHLQEDEEKRKGGKERGKGVTRVESVCTKWKKSENG